MKFLIFGDVVGRVGRRAVTTVLPTLRREFQPDSVIVNAENSAHGNGISPAILPDLLAWQADALTLGDHAWDNRAGLELLEDKKLPFVRPANYPSGVPGRGYTIFTKGAWQIAVINLQGQVFMKNQPANPFLAIDELLKQADIKQAHIKLIDFHTEASSEKRAFGLYVDGRVSAVWGTHTHVPTADAEILPNGTGYISDVGMNGAAHSVIGFDPAGPLKGFTQQIPFKRETPEDGPADVNAVLIEVDPTSGLATHIEHIRRRTNLKGGETS